MVFSISMNSYLYVIVNYFFNAVYYLLMARILLSWIPHDKSHPVIDFLFKATDPILEPFRRLIPTGSMGIDFSPILAFMALGFIKRILLQILFR
jgi:YggT family protein